MKNFKNLLFLILLMLAFACQSTGEKAMVTEVKHAGALKTMMSGNLQPVISLDSLEAKQHLYALGAAENLKGEIQVFDSKASNSFVKDSSLQLNDSYNLKATLLVYAQVEEWDAVPLATIEKKEDLEAAIFEIAKDNGINVEEPFPFLLEGKVASLDWHVINWKEGDTIHNHKKHKESGLSGTLTNRDVQILGFYSTKHKAVFTHHTTNMHMHFKTEDTTIAGHVDDLALNGTITLKIPKQ